MLKLKETKKKKNIERFIKVYCTIPNQLESFDHDFYCSILRKKKPFSFRTREKKKLEKHLSCIFLPKLLASLRYLERKHNWMTELYIRSAEPFD